MELTAEKLGVYIPDLRKKAGLSQQDLAELAGLSRTAIQGVESGKESLQIDTLLKICQVLNIRLAFFHPLLTEESPDEILDLSGDEK